MALNLGQVLEWVEMAALPNGEDGQLLPTIRAAFQSMDIDGEELRDLKDKRIVKELGKSGVDDKAEVREASSSPHPHLIINSSSPHPHLFLT